MGNNGTNDQNIVKLGGWEFKKVKDGLDEAQVSSFISELTNQRDELAQRTEHLSSLTKLAERTVIEADKLAEEIKAKAFEEARTEAASIIAQAEAKAQQIEDEAKRIQMEIRDSANELLTQLLSGVQALKQQVTTLQRDSERRLSHLEDKPSKAATASDEKPADSQETTPPTSRADTEGLSEKKATSHDQDTVSDKTKLDLQLEILPPLDIMEIMEIVTYLDNLPEVENTELIPNTERPSITVALSEPINLIDMLKTLPVVAHVGEDKAEPEGSEGKPPTIQIRLAEKSVPQEAS